MENNVLQLYMCQKNPTFYIRPYTKVLKADLERFMRTTEVTREVEITKEDGNLYKVVSRFEIHHPNDFVFGWWGRLYRLFIGMAKTESTIVWPNTERRFYQARVGALPIEKVGPVLI